MNLVGYLNALPTACPGVPAVLPDSRTNWSDEPAYDAEATTLAGKRAATVVICVDRVPAAVLAAGPHRE